MNIRAKSTIKRSRPRDAGQKDALISKYSFLRDKGHAALEAAEIVGVPLSTLNRWMTKQYNSNDSFQFGQIGITIDDALFRLCAEKQRLEFAHIELVEALAVLVSWLRWPSLDSSRHLGVLSFVSSYAYRKYGKKYMSELNSDMKRFLEQNLRLDLLAQICSDRAIYFPTFWRYEFIEDGPQDENACLSDIAWYLMAHNSATNSTRDRASLGKAIYLANQNAFKYPWSSSSSTIRRMLDLRAPAAPFIYAQDQTSLSFPMEIDAADFVETVDEFLCDVCAMRDLFGKARWIVETLQSKLDRRALHAFSFPSFPTNLQARPFPVSPLTDKILMALKDYRAADKTLSWQPN